MLTIRNKPFNYFNNFDVLFDNIFNESLRSTANTSYHYEENESEILIEMALPGLNKKNIKLSYIDGLLKIKHAAEENNRSRWTQDFNETIKIVKDIDENKISAKFENGIIYITIPKKSKIENEKIIKIK